MLAQRAFAAAMMAALLLAGCAPLSRSVVSLDGAPTDEPARVARLVIDERDPLLLKGLDGRELPVRVPSALFDWIFVVAPGRHVLWLTDVPAGHPLLPQFLRCYVMDATLQAGQTYVLRHDLAGEQAQLRRANTGVLEATGRLVDKPFVVVPECRWDGIKSR
jgi:hypothetical protein